MPSPTRRRCSSSSPRSRPRRTGVGGRRTSSPALNEREKIGSTGFGGGVAIPHGKIEGLDRVFGYFVRLATPDRLPGGRRAAGRPGLPAAVAARCGRRSSQGAGRRQPRAARPRRRSPSCAAPARRTRSSPCSPASETPRCGLTKPRPRAQRPISARSNRSIATRRSTACSSPELEIAEAGVARIRFEVDAAIFHAAGAAHGTLYFKMLDDAAFYACNSLVTDRFLLTTAFNLALHPAAASRAGGRRRPLGQRPAPRLRRRGAADRRRRRGSGARHRHLHALAHRAVRPCRATDRRA